VSSGTRLLAIDTKTGKLALEFGDGGFVEMGAAMQSPPVSTRTCSSARRPGP
jgi:glucose dehydrogenase